MLSPVEKNCLQEIAARIHGNAKKKGWWDRDDPTFNTTFEARLLLLLSEVHEAYDDVRNGHPLNEIYSEERGDDQKPCGVPIELADVFIRLMDIAVGYDINLIDAIAIKMQYNMTRPFRHGGKKS